MEDWRKLRKPLMDKIGFLFSSGMFVDVTLNVTDGKTKKTFQAHSVFLKMASPVFEKMFESEFVEKSHVVDIDEVDPEVFGIFLKFLYFDNVDLQSYDEASEVLKVADRFLVEPLKDLCSSFMIPKLTVTNALHAHSIGDIYHVDDLKEKAHKIIIAETKEVLSSENFNKADEKLVLSLLDEPTLNIREFELFKLVEEWLNKRPDKINLNNAVIQKFRFLSMTTDEFAAGPSQSDLLTSDQKLAILLKITSKISTVLPDGLAISRRLPYQAQSILYFNHLPLLCVGSLRKLFGNVITVDQKVTIEKLEVTICECSNRDTELKISILLANRNVCVTKNVNGIKIVLIELDNPVTLSPGHEYLLNINFGHNCEFKVVDLTNVDLEKDGVNFHFRNHSRVICVPLYSIHFRK